MKAPPNTCMAQQQARKRGSWLSPPSRLLITTRSCCLQTFTTASLERKLDRSCGSPMPTRRPSTDVSCTSIAWTGSGLAEQQKSFVQVQKAASSLLEKSCLGEQPMVSIGLGGIFPALVVIEIPSWNVVVYRAALQPVDSESCILGIDRAVMLTCTSRSI